MKPLMQLQTFLSILSNNIIKSNNALIVENIDTKAVEETLVAPSNLLGQMKTRNQQSDN